MSEPPEEEDLDDLDEMIREETERDPNFPKLMKEAEQRRKAQQQRKINRLKNKRHFDIIEVTLNDLAETNGETKMIIRYSPDRAWNRENRDELLSMLDMLFRQFAEKNGGTLEVPYPDLFE